MKSNVVTVSRRYGEDLVIDLDLNYRRAVELMYQRFALNAPERSALGWPATTTELLDSLNALNTPTQKHQTLLQHLQEHRDVRAQAGWLVKPMLPTFMYVSSYDRMDGAIQLEQANNLVQNNELDREDQRGVRLFCEFLEYAGVSMDEILNVQTYETFNAKLQAASNNITDQILEYWTQNPDLDVLVRVEQARPGDPAPFNSGTIARARIVNQLHRVDTPFSERSAGFVWFFSFLVKFAQIKADESPVVLLLDEPGLSLHGKAQADLLRFFEEKLAPHHQIVPFVSLFAGNQLHVAVLSDQSAGDKKKLERITKSGILQAGHLYSIVDFIDADEGDVEDLFAPELFIEIVNSCYALEDSLVLTIDKINSVTTSSPRIVKRVEELFRLLPDDLLIFDHFAPSSWLIRNPAALEGPAESVKTTLARADGLFRTYNELL